MQVILTENIPTLGVVGDLCKVKPGYGRNYLIPRGMAIMATPGALKQVDGLKRAEQKRQDRVRFEMRALAGRIEKVRPEFSAHVGETGRLYGSVTASQIAEAIEAAIGEPIDRRKIMLDESIRTLGEHRVRIHLMPEVDATVTVTVHGIEAETLPPELALAAAGDESEPPAAAASDAPDAEHAEAVEAFEPESD